LTQELRFIADGMLGKLTRWLRMLGCNVEYVGDIDDKKLMEKAEKEKRVLLTSDVELYRRAELKGIKTFLVKSTNIVDELAKIALKFNLSLEMNADTSRCPKCNSKVRRASKEEVKGLIPEGTWKRKEVFWICVGCGQIYWIGSHWKRINKTLFEAKRKLEFLKRKPQHL